MLNLREFGGWSEEKWIIFSVDRFIFVHFGQLLSVKEGLS